MFFTKNHFSLNEYFQLGVQLAKSAAIFCPI